jgi:hypothetical protein
MGTAMVRLITLLAALALLFAPFGRLAAAETMSHAGAGSAHHLTEAPPGHCDESMVPAPAEPDGAMIDCMTACATMLPGAMEQLGADEFEGAPPIGLVERIFEGMNWEADPPPPRMS